MGETLKIRAAAKTAFLFTATPSSSENGSPGILPRSSRARPRVCGASAKLTANSHREPPSFYYRKMAVSFLGGD